MSFFRKAKPVLAAILIIVVAFYAVLSVIFSVIDRTSKHEDEWAKATAKVEQKT